MKTMNEITYNLIMNRFNDDKFINNQYNRYLKLMSYDYGYNHNENMIVTEIIKNQLNDYLKTTNNSNYDNINVFNYHAYCKKIMNGVISTISIHNLTNIINEIPMQYYDVINYDNMNSIVSNAIKGNNINCDGNNSGMIALLMLSHGHSTEQFFIDYYNDDMMNYDVSIKYYMDMYKAYHIDDDFTADVDTLLKTIMVSIMIHDFDTVAWRTIKAQQILCKIIEQDKTDIIVKIYENYRNDNITDMLSLLIDSYHDNSIMAFVSQTMLESWIINIDYRYRLFVSSYHLLLMHIIHDMTDMNGSFVQNLKSGYSNEFIMEQVKAIVNNAIDDITDDYHKQEIITYYKQNIMPYFNNSYSTCM